MLVACGLRPLSCAKVHALPASTQAVSDSVKEELKKAENGDKDSLKKAEDAYKKAIVLDKEKEIIEGVKSNSAKAFDNLEKDISHLKEKEAKVEEK